MRPEAQVRVPRTLNKKGSGEEEDQKGAKPAQNVEGKPGRSMQQKPKKTGFSVGIKYTVV